MLFLVTLKKVVVACTTEESTIPTKNPTDEEIWIRDAWTESYFICKNLILNELIDELYDHYSTMSTAKEIWNVMQKKY